MISRKTLFSSLVLLLGCVFFAACTDDWATGDQGDSGGNVAIRLSVPFSKEDAADPEKRIDNMHLLVFSRSGNILRYEQLKSDFTNQQVLLPVGNCDLYLVGNYPSGATPGLEAVTSVSDLEELLFSQEKIVASPFIMCGIYKNVLVNNKAQLMYGGEDISKKLQVERLVAKFTLDLKFKPKPGESGLSIDSVRLYNQAGYSWLIARSYAEDSRYPLATTKKAEEMKNDSAHYEFYLPEYIVTEDTKKRSTYAKVYAHVKDSENTPIEYTIYVGEWFGYSKKYHEFDWEKNPENPSEVTVKGEGSKEKIGIEGLKVNRNKHYIFTGSINGTGIHSYMEGAVSIKDWNVVEIDMDIIGIPELSLSDTEVMVNVLSPTVVVYKTNLDSMEVVSIEPNDIGTNGHPRFSVEVRRDSILFIHNPNMRRYTTDGTTPITATVTLKASSKSKKTSITKNIKISSFLPLAKASLKQISGAYAGYLWADAAGYKNPYSLNYNGLKGRDANKTYMDGAPVDGQSGCATYYEGTENDYFLGKGNWRLPTKEEAEVLQHVMHTLSFSEESIEVLNHNVWTSTELKGTPRSAYLLYGTGVLEPASKSSGQFVRCIRSSNPQRSESASYLSVSHDYYELSFTPVKRGENDYSDAFLSSLPIYYEADLPVEYAIYDSEGNDIGGTETLEPYFFVFNTSDPNDILVPYSIPNGGNLGIPLYETRGNGWYYQIGGKIRDYYFQYHSDKGADIALSRKKSGYLHLYPNITSQKDGASNLLFAPAQYSRLAYSLNGNKDFLLVLRAGSNFTKSIRIRMVDQLGKKDLGPMNYFEAMGVSQNYVGYNLSTNQLITTPVDLYGDVTRGSLVSDIASGCSEYFEGSPSDPYTGKGCWYLSWVFPNQLMDYVQRRRVYNTMTANRRDSTAFEPIGAGNMDGKYPTVIDGTYWDTYMGIQLDMDTEYWTVMSAYLPGEGLNNQDPQKQRVLSMSTALAEGSNGELVRIFGIPVDKLSHPASARCVRRTNADALQLSDRLLKFPASSLGDSSASRQVTFYTSSPGGIEVKQLSYDPSNAEPFTVSYPKGSTSGAITIHIKSGTTRNDSHVNLLVSSVRSGALEKMKTYRIVKVKIE